MFRWDQLQRSDNEMESFIILIILIASTHLANSSDHTWSEPSLKCEHLGKMYGPGEIPFSKQLPCHNCYCEVDQDNSTLMRKSCVIAWCGNMKQQCKSKPGHTVVEVYGQCCPDCVRVAGKANLLRGVNLIWISLCSIGAIAGFYSY